MTLKTGSIRYGSNQQYAARSAFHGGATRDSFARTLSFFASVLS